MGYPGPAEHASNLEDELQTVFGSRFRVRRRKLKKTHKQVADPIDVHPKTIGNWESGRDIPSFYTGCRAAIEVNVHPFYLAGFTDNPDPGEQLSEDERAFIDFYRQLPSDRRIMWRNTVLDAMRVERIGRKAKA